MDREKDLGVVFFSWPYGGIKGSKLVFFSSTGY